VSERTWDKLVGLPLVVDGYALEGLERDVSSDFTRLSTIIHLHGGGEEGLSEDVTYDALDHIALQVAGAVHDLAGRRTLGEFCALVGALDLFPSPPIKEVSRRYRRWAFESAALDLALRQAGISLADALGREPQPVRYVVSLRLGEPPTLEPLTRRLDAYPGLRFKLDPTNSWTPELIAAVVATGAVEALDLKGQYHGTIVDVQTDPALYANLVAAFPDAWLEDPDLNDQTEPILAAHRDRITWDAPIHSIADIEALPFPPRMVNIKPSRLGSLEELLDAYDYCAARGIGGYGGGQFELGVGRGQIQYLAALFHANAPNDVAPAGFNDPHPPPGLPPSPIAPRPSATGFRWEA
jgi:hypothetical protein